MRGVVVAAPASRQGKTVVTLGLIRALRRAGVQVTPAKAGPDYIDAAFLARAAGRDALTLDPFAMTPDDIRARAGIAEAVVVEGAMGLLDGPLGADGRTRGATADVARALGLPVVLVIDVARQGQTAGAAAAGIALAARQRGVSVRGVVLNRVASPRHAAMVRAGLPDTLPVLAEIAPGSLPALPERHLGLVQAAEHPALDDALARAADAVGAAVAPGSLLAPSTRDAAPPAPRRLPVLSQRIAVARDRAFAFAYAHMLDDWRRAGAEVLPFSPLADEPPDPAADAIFLPGGYPELHAGVLAQATRFRDGVHAAVGRGARVYGECGGYMVLGRGLVDESGARHAMLGLLGLETSFAERRRHLGARILSPCLTDGPLAHPFLGHEWHYATTLSAEGQALFHVTDAAGTDLGPQGLVEGRVAGSFAHIVAIG